MSSPDFTGFGVVLELGLTIGLIVGLSRRRWAAPDGRSSAVAHFTPKAIVDDAKASQREVFAQLQTLLVNYPTVAKAAQAKPEMPAKNIVPLFTPLGNLMAAWGYAPIGQPWAEVEFNPQWHQPDVPDIQPGEAVYVRFVGYRDGATILVPAKVSRSLPQG
jgi:hypothetical protein